MPSSSPPPDIARAGIPGAPIDYAWSTDVSDGIVWASDEDDPALARAITPLSLRAGMALLAAAVEWVAWRYAGIVDITDALQRVEAGYAAAVDPARARLPMPDEPFPRDKGKAQGPLKLARMLLSWGFEALRRGDSEVLSRAFSAILLARHVVPDVVAFEAWLEDVLRRSDARFPRTPLPLDAQPSIAPSFFESGADSRESSLRDRMEEFVRGLSSANPYLLP